MFRTSGTLLLASALFFASGALGLGYQLVWVKKAALIVGGSQIALSTVVTSFFLGLALGSLYVGRHLRSRRWSPLVIYGGFEVAIGLFALAFPLLFSGVESIYSSLHPYVSESATALFALRFGLLFFLFLVPTFFMGGTLPLLLDGLVARDRSVGSLSSFLYGLNTAGAVGGVLVTGFWAVPVLGMNGTSTAAGFGNLLIGAIAFVAFRNTPPLHAPEAEGEDPGHATSVGMSRPARLFVLMSFLSGFAALGYQIAWARHFSLFTPPSAHFTSVLLAVYLFALAAGSMLLSLLLRRGLRPLRLLAISQALVPALLFSTLWSWLAAYHAYWPDGNRAFYLVQPSWAFWSDSVDGIFLAPLLRVGLVLFAPVVLLGMGLPALIAASARTSTSLRGIAGSLVFWNTVGSSAGGFVAGYLLIPGLGLTYTFVFLSTLTVGLAVLAEMLLGSAAIADEPSAATSERRHGWLSRVRPGVVLGVLSLAFAVGSIDEDIVTKSIRLYGQAQQARLIDHVEGPLTTAYVLDGRRARLLGSGSVRVAAAFKNILSFQAVQGALPALFYPLPGTPKDVLGIALGSGQTFGGMLLHPIEHMDVVDISTEIVELSLEHFQDFQHGLGRDPRVTFHLDDGRHFVARAEPNSYDVVTTEPPPPTDDGIYVLYSYEFYREVRRILRDGGVFVNWVPLNLLTPNDVRGVLKTQASVFPYTFLIKWGPADFSTVSFDLDTPPLFEREWLEERVRRFAVERKVAGFHWPGPATKYSLDTVEGVVALVLTGPEQIEALDFPLIHHEDDQRLAYSSGDRHLLRHYLQAERMDRIAYTGIPLAPMDQLQQYFAWRLPIEELAEDRAAGLRHRFGVPSLGALRSATLSWEAEQRPSVRAGLAMRIAKLHDGELAKAEVHRWLGRAIADGASSASHVEMAHEIAQHGIGIYSEQLRSWLATLDASHADSPIVRAVQADLGNFDRWDAKRRARYWFE